MYDLSNEQRLKLTIVLMEYLNAGDWKGLFELTGCEEFAQQHTQFYEDVSWENETLEQDCTEALEFILTKDSGNLKVIWGLGGVQTILSRKDADLHREIEVLIEDAEVVANPDISNTNSNVSNTIPDVFETKQSAYNALEDAETLLETEGATIACNLMHAALHGFLKQVCTNKSIDFDTCDAITVLLLKVNDYIKGQADTAPNEKTLSMLRAAASMVDTINDLRTHHSQSHQNEKSLTETDAKFAINLARSIMSYIDELVS